MYLLNQQTPIITRTPDVIVYNWPTRRGLVEGYASGSGLITASYINFADKRVMPTSITEATLNEMYDWTESWNGYGVPRPQFGAIESARAWIRLMYIDSGHSAKAWMDPHVTSNEDGNVTFEWWCANRKLTVYVSQHEAWYIKVWGPDVVNEMIDGTAESSEERQDIWSWLVQ